MQVKILFISTIWTSSRTRKNDNNHKHAVFPVVFPNVFSECIPRAGVWIIDDLRCQQSVATTPQDATTIYPTLPYTQRRKCATATKHEALFELNRLILFTANFCLKVDLISGETGFLQEQFHSVYATATLTCSSVKGCFPVLRVKFVYVPIISWMFRDKFTTTFLLLLSVLVHFPHVLLNKDPRLEEPRVRLWLLPPVAKVGGRCSVVGEMMSILDTWWTLVEIERRHSTTMSLHTFCGGGVFYTCSGHTYITARWSMVFVWNLGLLVNM